MVLLLIGLFVLGCCIGSFINASEYRLAKSLPIANDRSRCRSCKKPLAWYDLIPLVSFLVLSGKCRSCHAPISKQYPLVEAATGALFALAGYMAGLSGADVLDGQTIFRLMRDIIVVSVAVFLFVYDYKYTLLPDAVTVPSIVLFAACSWWLGLHWQSLLVGMVVGGGFFLVQYAVSSGAWVGGGDIRFGAMLGALFGWPMVLVALFVSYVTGAVVGGGLLALGKKKPGDAIPFGTFLSVGMLFTLWWGEAVIAWYAQWL